MDLIIFGIQGSGKGTVAKALAEKFDMNIFETGAELRKISQENSELGKKVKSIIESGNLVPNEVVMEIVKNFIENFSPHKAIIFDGIPRMQAQAETLHVLLKKEEREFIPALLKVSKETAIERILSRRVIKDGKEVKRKDDKPEIIKKRFEIFFEKTQPVINSYKNLIEIDGEPGIEEVRETSMKILKPYLKK